MDESILVSVKLALGITKDYEFFDPQLIMYINAALATLVQNGVGEPGFTISNDLSKWSDFLGEKTTALEYVKVYVISKVRLMFDPPQSSGAQAALKELAAEYEWRGYIECDELKIDDESGDSGEEEADD